ncbi:MAG: hypothetical protein K1X78_09355 [Verrucomicrobiaceae bacterium]|nr:hypothetical protein [Verrucomicrobiaceae bacterium]
MKLSALLLLPVTSALLACAAPCEARTWTDTTGRKIEVQKWRVEGGMVILNINGKDSPVPLAKLSKEDQEFARQWADEHANTPTPPSDRADGKADALHPAKLPNGDVVLDHLPAPPLEDEVRNYIPLSVALVLEKHFHWPADILALAKKMNWQPDRTDWDQAKFYNAIGKETHSRVLYSDKLDIEEVIRAINKGRPVVVWRCWEQTRDTALIAFEKELKNDPQAKLPSARDEAERKKWPKEKNESTIITSMIIGYNRQRGEVMLHIPYWGADYACFRMRKEEMDVSGYAFWFFEPK